MKKAPGFKDWCCRTSHIKPVLIAAAVVGLAGVMFTFVPVFMVELIKFAVDINDKSCPEEK